MPRPTPAAARRAISLAALAALLAAGPAATTRPDVGDPLPAFSLQRAAGGKPVTNAALAGKPAVVVFGSWSAPSFRDQLPRIAELAGRYGGRVEWLVVYTREAFPNDADGPARNRAEQISATQPATESARLAVAKKMVAQLKLRLDVAVDSIDDAFTNGVGGFPNAAIVLDRDSKIVARFDWAEPFAIKRRLDELLALKPTSRPTTTRSEPRD